MNSYSFIRVVGKGSYGEVNLVKHKSERKQYVIKKLNLTTSSKRERRAAEQEAQLLSQLRHPNIVTYRESWEGDDCQLYIVMGFCEGGDLYHRLKQQKGELLPERQVVEWFVQIAMALQYLHERNILHRDLKTQNIFLTKTNIIKVGDLGIARVLENQNDMASTLIGTPYYMSPELFSNKPYNYKSDVWALGCCVYEMCTLKHAFNAKDMNSLVYRIVEGKLPQMPSRYDSQLGSLIKSMLCKKPEDRPEVKLILRQPFIKRQIGMFLEATKEKTARSRMKAAGGSGDDRANSVRSAVSERLPVSPQPEPPARVRRKEEKPQQHKSRNGVSDDRPALAAPAPKGSSSDALKDSTESLATISNINIDIQLQKEEEPRERRLPRAQAVVSRHHAGNGAPSAPKDKKGRGKPELCPSPTPLQPPQSLISGVGSRGETPNGLLDFHPQATPDPGEAFSDFAAKQTPVADNDDTMELLREADMQNQKLKAQIAEKHAVRRSTHKANAKNIIQISEMKMDNKGDTVTLLRGAPTQNQTSDVHESLESTEKLLEPLPPTALEDSAIPVTKLNLATPGFTPLHESSELSVSEQRRQTDVTQTHGEQDKFKVAGARPLPPLPVDATAMEVRKRSRGGTESKKTNRAAASKSSKDSLLAVPQDRPLSARERRRLRQSQESSSQTGVSAVRRASYDVTSSKAEHHNVPVTRSVSVSEDRMLERRSDEEECSSSTSSTERSEGDCREGKSECGDMQDLVTMMTQTLRLDSGEGVSEMNRSQFGSTALPEFKLNRKYRDTLMLHGKALEEVESLPLGDLPMGSRSGPAKVRRVIEHLRTDVVKALGVKLLDRVLEIMEEEDDTKRELRLRDQMGEKYQAYAVMVRQLKFFEDVALKV
ncbi:serine/threonine-protein kinase Nek4 [Genypterus blacodes]|uniref:serine/threonine-protein kinase Nek4 n=1 Tax=Genypterus blacodes TaxID=154954 RepID=UPI003F767535